MNKGQENWQLMERACGALVLAYSPDEVLVKEGNRSFYIPCCNEVEEAFGFSLREIFGSKDAGCSWHDVVRWAEVKNLNKLEKRILEETKEVILGNPDCATIFECYFSSLKERFYHTWVYMMGDLYMFREGNREQELKDFDSFWNKKEKTRWTEIHKFMREYTKKQYMAKGKR